MTALVWPSGRSIGAKREPVRAFGHAVIAPRKAPPDAFRGDARRCVLVLGGGWSYFSTAGSRSQLRLSREQMTGATLLPQKFDTALSAIRWSLR